MRNMKSFVKSPLNYVGGKFKLLPSICEHLPNTNINTVYDIFGGGYNVGINIDASKHVYNDADGHVVGIIKKWHDTPLEELLSAIDSLVGKYQLSKTNQEGYLRIRDDYNKSPDKDAVMLYTIICHAFNYQIRFNSKGEYNMPFGKERSCFNDALRKKFVEYVNKLQSQDTVFLNGSYSGIQQPTVGDFIYADPPYLNSVAAYNEKGGWTEKDEKELLGYLDGMDERGVKFMLSNNLKYNNSLLEEWMRKYKVIHIGSQYSNCNYHKKDKSEDDEILVVNY